MKREELIDLIAEHLMITTRGYKSKGDWPIEWDKERDDSQIAMVIEDVDAILTFLEKDYGYNFSPKTLTSTNSYVFGGSGGGGFSTGSTIYYSPATPVEPEIDGVQTDVDIRIRTRKSPNLSEIKEFIERLELLGCDPTTEVVGSLSFTKRIEDSMASRITCGDCGEDDVILSDHSCN